MKLSRRWILSVAVLILSLHSGCGGNTGPKKAKVAVVTNNAADFWSICEAGARQAEQDLAAKGVHVEVIFRMPEKGEVSSQNEIINAVVKQGISGIAISVIDPKEQKDDLNRIAGQVNLLTMDNDAPETKRKCYIGTDNYAAGRAVGRLIKEAMPEGGTIAIFVGQIAPLNARERRDGVLHELAGVDRATTAEDKLPKGPKYGKYELYGNAVKTDGASEQTAQDNAKDVLNTLKDTPNVCMVGLWAYNPPAILEAARSLSAVGKIKIVGFDEDPNTLVGIDKGEIYASVVQDPFNFGYKSVEALAYLAQGDDSKLLKDAVPHRIVTKDGKAVTGEKEKRLVAIDYKKQLEDQIKSVKKK